MSDFLILHIQSPNWVDSLMIMALARLFSSVISPAFYFSHSPVFQLLGVDSETCVSSLSVLLFIISNGFATAPSHASALPEIH